MNGYTEILEFFMENNIQLTSDQMENLYTVCNEATDHIKLDFNKCKSIFKKKFNNTAIKINLEDEDEDNIIFGEYDVHKYPAFKRLGDNPSREELIEVVNKDFYEKFDKVIDQVNKSISGSISIDGDWDTGYICYKTNKQED